MAMIPLRGKPLNNIFFKNIHFLTMRSGGIEPQSPSMRDWHSTTELLSAVIYIICNLVPPIIVIELYKGALNTRVLNFWEGGWPYTQLGLSANLW